MSLDPSVESHGRLDHGSKVASTFQWGYVEGEFEAVGAWMERELAGIIDVASQEDGQAHGEEMPAQDGDMDDALRDLTGDDDGHPVVAANHDAGEPLDIADVIDELETLVRRSEALEELVQLDEMYDRALNI